MGPLSRSITEMCRGRVIGDCSSGRRRVVLSLSSHTSDLTSLIRVRLCCQIKSVSSEAECSFLLEGSFLRLVALLLHAAPRCLPLSVCSHPRLACHLGYSFTRCGNCCPRITWAH